MTRYSVTRTYVVEVDNVEKFVEEVNEAFESGEVDAPSDLADAVLAVVVATEGYMIKEHPYKNGRVVETRIEVTDDKLTGPPDRPPYEVQTKAKEEYL